MADVGPDEAARIALGDDTPALEGGELEDASSGGEQSWLERLWDGDAPGPSVADLQADYPLPQWASIGLRGVLRTATGSGVPPIFEIGLAGVLAFMQGTSSSGDGDADGGGGGETLEIEEVA